MAELLGQCATMVIAQTRPDTTPKIKLFPIFNPLRLFLIENHISSHLESMVFSKQRLVALLVATSAAKLAATDPLPQASVSVPDASSCLPDSGLTALSGCLAMSSYVGKCKALSATKSIINCWCQQEMLSDVYAYAGFLLSFPVLSSLTIKVDYINKYPQM